MTLMTENLHRLKGFLSWNLLENQDLHCWSKSATWNCCYCFGINAFALFAEVNFFLSSALHKGRRAHFITFCLYFLFFRQHSRNPLSEHQTALRVSQATFKHNIAYPQQLKGSIMVILLCTFFIVWLSSSVYRWRWGVISNQSEISI